MESYNAIMDNKRYINELKEKLERQNSIGINDININDIDNINTINMNEDKPSINRILDFIIYIKNPYIIKVDDTIVKMEFSNTKVKADECMNNLFCNLYLTK